ncbi:MAG TPA: hypothetical protein EYP04_04415 [Anaerolineae bacterium]|nr:hypothetical protein [Anaerolineae bacterium]HIQ04605.1 hypothetical protein [Anaerolineae bacterium]
MECPQCGTWNPDDRTVCWRCQAPLPKKKEEKKKKAPTMIGGLPAWTWAVLAIMLVFWFAIQCSAPMILGNR